MTKDRLSLQSMSSTDMCTAHIGIGKGEQSCCWLCLPRHRRDWSGCPARLHTCPVVLQIQISPPSIAEHVHGVRALYLNVVIEAARDVEPAGAGATHVC